jgi:hypothetical protein
MTWKDSYMKVICYFKRLKKDYASEKNLDGSVLLPSYFVKGFVQEKATHRRGFHYKNVLFIDMNSWYENKIKSYQIFISPVADGIPDIRLQFTTEQAKPLHVPVNGK